MSDLYGVLGLERKASATHVRAAYRRLVKAHHPDKGGDRAVFERVQHAYDVLVDVNRRDRYDRTGDAAEVKIDDPVEVMAMGLIGQLLGSIVGQDGEAAVRRDLVALMVDTLRKQAAEHESNRQRLGLVEANIVRLRSRFSRKDGGQENRIAVLLGHQLVEAQRGREALARAVVGCERAIEILSDYRFTFDAVQVMTGWSSANSQTYILR